MKDIVDRVKSMAGTTVEDKEYVSDATLAVLHDVPKSHRMVLKLSLALFIVAVLWASIARVDEVVRAQGTAIPSGKVQLVQSFDGGLLQSLDVTEGQKVDKGQLLLTIDDTDFQSNVIRTETELYAALAKSARLIAEVTGSEPVYDAQLDNRPALIIQENRLLELRREEYEAEVSISELERRESRQELDNLKRLRVSLQDQLRLITQERELNAPLVERGAAPALELIRIDKSLSEVQSRLVDNQGQMNRTETKIQRLDRTIERIKSSFKERAQGELAEVNAAIKIAQAGLSSDDARAKRSQLVSPTAGIIKKIWVTTIGAVIQPGNDIVEVIPLDDEIIFEARVNPKDIGFIKNGSEASVKVTAYEFATYGGLKAHVSQISADTMIDQETGATYYLVRLNVKNTLNDASGNTLPILPGMEASIDIKVSNKSVLSYIFKPLLRMVKS